MTIAEVIPVVTEFSHADKFKLVQLLLSQLAAEEAVTLQPFPTDFSSDPLFEIIGVATDGVGDVSSRHDDYLYGTP